MSCTKPLLMDVFSIPLHSQNQGYYERLLKQGWKLNKDKTKAYHFVSGKSRNMPLEKIEAWQTHDLVEIPCGSCLQCRIDYAQDWAIRCHYEAQLYKHNYFVTLNYDDEHVPVNRLGNMTLDKKHISTFINSLRKKFERLGHKGIRYILCGEYNSSGERVLNPHYHMILFNCPIPDLTFNIPHHNKPGQFIHKMNEFTGMPYLYSKFIADLWSDENGKVRGQVIIDDANFNTSGYVSRYIMKKQKGQSGEVYTKDLEVVPPFLRMSNRPGLGYNLFLENKDSLVEIPFVTIPRIGKKPLITGIPKFYKRKLFELDDSLREKFELNAKLNQDRLRSLRASFGHTSNQQKEAIETRAESIALNYQRNNT